MRSIEGDNRIRNGLMGIIILALVIGVGQSFASVPMIFATPTFYAQFSDTGGLNPGDKVRIAGVDVGQVRSMDIEGDKIARFRQFIDTAMFAEVVPASVSVAG